MAAPTVYRLHDSLTDLSCGITEQIVGLFLKGLLFLGYLGTYAYATRSGINLVDVEAILPAASGLAAIVLFLGVDCAYYWFHRVAHEYNAPWAGHVVHHSSEDYNLAVALRQGTFQGLFSWVFYLPLALIGFPPAWFAAVSSFDTLYQFWIHTRLIGKLGPLEWVFNTPSHHRVHHARNPKYLDRNYAGTLIIWDRMFGTFQAEEEEPVYGLVKPLNSWNPLWANLHVWGELFRDAWLAPRLERQASDLVHAAGLEARGPASQPQPARGVAADGHPLQHSDAARLNVYALAHFVVALVAAFGLLAAGGRSLTRGELVIAAVLVLWALLNIGGIFERRLWALFSELVRLPVTSALVAVRLHEIAWLSPGLAFAVVAFWLYLLGFRREFDFVARPHGRKTGYPVPHADPAEGRTGLLTAPVPSGGLEQA